jgi:sRNA-binding regulator protein Hfq
MAGGLIMSKLWINPAFKDKVPEGFAQRHEKGREKKEEKKFVKKDIKKKFTKGKEKKPVMRETGTDPLLEHKLLQYLMEKNVGIEAKFIEGTELKGKIKWFSDFMVGIEVDGKRNIICNRLMMLYYKQDEGNSPSEKEITSLPDPVITSAEITAMQQLKDNKHQLIFHLKNNIVIKGKLEWYEKLIYHIMSLDGTKDYNIQKSSLIYFEEVLPE